MALRESRLGRMPSRIVNMLRERVHKALAADREWSVSDDALCLHSLATHPPRRIEIQFRPDGDVDVAFFLEQVRGSPFEQHLLVAGEPIDEAAVGIATFANDIVAERLVLVWKGFPAGRRFIQPADALDARWVASWLGTYDRDLPSPP
jgi:hypothetical protein